ncbi:hypothetical protein [Endozoicomonas sp.]|uniref:hypothetical protein n=1 Tax=Endozoicomonas sp. TaxID=1892382 RepID=UPI003AF959DB
MTVNYYEWCSHSSCENRALLFQSFRESTHENTIHRISFDGYTHESEDTLSISIDRINGDHNLERMNEDILRKIDHKRYQNHSKNYHYGNKSFNVGQRIIFDAQNNHDTPYYLSWITDRQSVNYELLNNIVLPGFIYLRVSSKSQITPIGLMSFKEKEHLQNLFKSSSKPGDK